MMRVAALTAMILAMTVPAAADDPEPPRVSASFGVGVANPLHGDLSFTAFAWQASVRIATARHLVVEPFFGEWRHTTSRVIDNVVIHGPSGNVLGQVDRITQRTEEIRPAIGFNMLGAWSSGVVTFSAGGGPGFLLYERRSTEKLEGCRGNAQCTGYDHRFTSGSFSVQATGAVDVRVASRFGAFGEFRLAVPVEDVGSGQTSVIGGIRVRVW